jgi:hypothetical protein
MRTGQGLTDRADLIELIYRLERFRSDELVRKYTQLSTKVPLAEKVIEDYVLQLVQVGVLSFKDGIYFRRRKLSRRSRTG